MAETSSYIRKVAGSSPARPNLENLTKPITPKEVTKKKAETIPEPVIAAFNDLIAKNWDGRQSVVRQKEVVARIKELMVITTNELFKHHWLDVEDVFRKAGWEVDFDQPGFNEDHYEPMFTFTVLKSKRANGV